MSYVCGRGSNFGQEPEETFIEPSEEFTLYPPKEEKVAPEPPEQTSDIVPAPPIQKKGSAVPMIAGAAVLAYLLVR